MPEGDTISRSARTLGRALTGRTVTAAAGSPRRPATGGVARLVGQEVGDVEARGKHLLVWFRPSGTALHTHLRMAGSWHLYRPGERWRKAAQRAVATLSVPGWTAVCFDAPVCEVLAAGTVGRHPVLARLGPDALDPEFDLAEARRRLDARVGWTLADALLDQSVLAGVGNVYKCEVLFVHGLHPDTPVEDVEPAVRDRVLAAAAALLRTNAGMARVPRTTTRAVGAPGGERLFVYGRAGRPCLRCGTTIRVAGQGAQARRTFWCPRCQPA